MEENKALIIKNPGIMQLETVPVPEIKDDELLIRVRYVAVCGSDIKLFDGAYTGPHKYPLIFGHEWLGEVIKAGSSTIIPAGKKVVGTCSVFCDDCYYCHFNKNHCEHIEKRGITIDGGACRMIAVKERHVICCPSFGNEKLLTLTEPVSVAVNGILNRIPSQVLQRVRKALIIGCGGIGIGSLLTLMNENIPEIVMIDIAEDKVSLIESMITGPEADGRTASHVTAMCTDVEDLAFKSDHFDLIVEATGAASSLQNAVYAAAPCAHIVMLGHQRPLTFDFGTLMQKSLTLHASNGSTGGFEHAMNLIIKYNDITEKMITAEIPCEEAPEYFRTQIHSPSKIKVLIDMN